MHLSPHEGQPLKRCLSVTPHALGAKFSDLLNALLSQQEINEVISRNASETNPLVCHSHDFCDANEAMFLAFKSFDLDPIGPIGPMTNSMIGLWNAAWASARQSGFRPGHSLSQ